MTSLSFEMELLAWAYDDHVAPRPGCDEALAALTGDRVPSPNPDCPRCEGSGSYRDGDGLREWTEDCPCLYGATCEREEMPL